jgi:hypothetical protein
MLIGHWPLTGNLNDYSGYNNNGTATNITYTTGKIGQAATFAVGSLIQANNGIAGIFNKQIFSWGAWIRMTGSSYRILMSATNRIELNIASSKLNISINGTDGWSSISGTTTLSQNVWYHVFATYGNGVAKIYVNGIQEGSLNKANFSTTGDNLLIGNWSSLTQSFVGNINDVRVYDHVLSDYEVKELAKAKVLHYTFDDPYEEPTINLLYDNGVTNWGIGSLTITPTVTTLIPNSRYTISNGATAGTFRFYIPLSKLENGATYNMSYNYKLISGSSGFTMADWCDTTLTKTDINYGSYIFSSAFGTRSTYDSTFRFMDFFIPASTTVEIWDIQLEKKSHFTPFVSGTRNIGIADLSGLKYNNFPTTTITPRWSSTSKLGSNSILFNGGLSHHLNLTEISAMPFNTGMTFSVWAYPTASSIWARFIDFGNGTPSNNILFARSSTSTTLTLHSYNGTTASTLSATGAIENNIWQHFAFTIASNGFSKIYKNGVVIASGTLNVPNVVTRNNMYIGRSNWVGDAYYNGSMDDIRLYTTALSDADVLSLYNKRANLDNLGNVSINEIDNTRSYFPTLPDYSTWTVGQRSATGWSPNGSSSENIIIVRDNPVGQDDIIWATLGNDADSGADGGYNGSSFAIDPTKTYRHTVWIKRENYGAGSGTTYIGIYGRNNADTNIGVQNLVGTNLTNPYHITWGYASYATADQWVLSVQYVMPAGSTAETTEISNTKGLYLANTTTRLNNAGATFRWRADNTRASIRSYLYYSTKTDERQYWYRPRFEEVNGNEPSLQDLINCSDNPILFGKTVADINKKALFNNNGQALFRDIDEYTGTLNTGAKQEINNNGTLLINGEFSEVD